MTVVSDFIRSPGKEHVGKAFSFENARDVEIRQQSALSSPQHGLRMPRRTLGEATKTPPLSAATYLTTATWRTMTSPDSPRFSPGCCPWDAVDDNDIKTDADHGRMLMIDWRQTSWCLCFRVSAVRHHSCQNSPWTFSSPIPSQCRSTNPEPGTIQDPGPPPHRVLSVSCRLCLCP